MTDVGKTYKMTTEVCLRYLSKRFSINEGKVARVVLLKCPRTPRNSMDVCFATRLSTHYLLFYLWIDNKSLLEWFGFSHSLLNLQTMATLVTGQEYHLKMVFFFTTIVYATTNVLIRPLETYINIISHLILFVK